MIGSSRNALRTTHTTTAVHLCSSCDSRVTKSRPRLPRSASSGYRSAEDSGDYNAVEIPLRTGPNAFGAGGRYIYGRKVGSIGIQRRMRSANDGCRSGCAVAVGAWAATSESLRAGAPASTPEARPATAATGCDVGAAGDAPLSATAADCSGVGIGGVFSGIVSSGVAAPCAFTADGAAATSLGVNVGSTMAVTGADSGSSCSCSERCGPDDCGATVAISCCVLLAGINAAESSGLVASRAISSPPSWRR